MVDLNLIESVDYSKIEAVKPYAFYLCRNFLENDWNQIELDEFKITRLKLDTLNEILNSFDNFNSFKKRGGQENFVYKCEIDRYEKEESKNSSKNIDKVVLK